MYVNVYFADQNIMQSEGPLKLNFKGFEMQKWNIPTHRAQRIDKKIGVIYLVIKFTVGVMGYGH